MGISIPSPSYNPFVCPGVVESAVSPGFSLLPFGYSFSQSRTEHVEEEGLRLWVFCLVFWFCFVDFFFCGTLGLLPLPLPEIMRKEVGWDLFKLCHPMCKQNSDAYK